MLSPKNTKYRKAHKGRIHGKAKGGYKLNSGSFRLKAVSPQRVTPAQPDDARPPTTRPPTAPGAQLRCLGPTRGGR